MSSALWRPGDMPRARPPRGVAPTVAELLGAGLSLGTVRRLGWLREHAEVIEFTTDAMSVYRLAFLRWLIARGAVHDGES